MMLFSMREAVEGALHNDNSSDIAEVGTMLAEDQKLVDRFLVRTSVDMPIWQGDWKHLGSTSIWHLL